MINKKVLLLKGNLLLVTMKTAYTLRNATYTNKTFTGETITGKVVSIPVKDTLNRNLNQVKYDYLEIPDTLDVEGIISNVEDEIGILRNEDGFICNRESDFINTDALASIVAEETKDDSVDVSAYVLMTVYNTLDEYALI